MCVGDGCFDEDAGAWDKDNNPQRNISKLELLGDVHLTEYYAEKYPGHAGTHTATASTDNYGNTYIIRKHFTSTFPNMCMTIELTDRLTRANLYLRVDHKDPNSNKWADALANQNSQGFDPKKRWHPTATMKIFNMTYKLMKKYRLDHARETKSNVYKQEQQKDINSSHTNKRTGHHIPTWVKGPKRQHKATTTQH